MATNQLNARLIAQQSNEKERQKEAWEMHMENLELKAKCEELKEKAYKQEQIAATFKNNLDALIDKLWERDNELLRKETMRLKLQGELNHLKVSIQSLQARLKVQSESTKHADWLLAEKNKEIDELMLSIRNEKKLGSPRKYQ